MTPFRAFTVKTENTFVQQQGLITKSMFNIGIFDEREFWFANSEKPKAMKTFKMNK